MAGNNFSAAALIFREKTDCLFYIFTKNPRDTCETTQILITSPVTFLLLPFEND